MLDSNESYGSFWKAVTYWNTWDINVVDTEECVFNKWIEILPQDFQDRNLSAHDLAYTPDYWKVRHTQF